MRRETGRKRLPRQVFKNVRLCGLPEKDVLELFSVRADSAPVRHQNQKRMPVATALPMLPAIRA
jgi:hypothetical protein